MSGQRICLRGWGQKELLHFDTIAETQANVYVCKNDFLNLPGAAEDIKSLVSKTAHDFVYPHQERSYLAFGQKISLLHGIYTEPVIDYYLVAYPETYLHLSEQRAMVAIIDAELDRLHPDAHLIVFSHASEVWDHFRISGMLIDNDET